MSKAIRFAAQCFLRKTRPQLLREQRRLQSSAGSLPKYTYETPSRDILQKATVQTSVLRDFLPNELLEPDHFRLEELVTVQAMFDARLHYGHKIGTLHPNMKWAVFGERLGVCIIDLEKSRQFLLRALNVVAHMAARGGMILFISSHRETLLDVERTAEECGEYSHVRRWQEGTLTNLSQLFGAPLRIPDLIIFMSSLTTLQEPHPAILEAAQMAIPTVGVVDTNADPKLITYLVPANDDTPQSVTYLLSLFKEAIKRGKDARRRRSE